MNTIKKNNLGTHRNIKIIRRLTPRKMIFEDTNAVNNLPYFNLKMAVNKYGNRLVFRLWIYE